MKSDMFMAMLSEEDISTKRPRMKRGKKKGPSDSIFHPLCITKKLTGTDIIILSEIFISKKVIQKN